MPSVKIGAVTVGQAPRVDVTADILPLLPGVELLERGGLDGLTREDIAAFQPEEGDYVLVSRLTDGSSVTFAEKYVLPRLQNAITELEDAGCRLILFFCTGDFPDTFQSRVPLLFPGRVLKGMAPAMMMAFSSASSVGTLPFNMECAERLGARREVSSFVLPLGATINMDGTAIYQCVATVFLAACANIQLTLGQMVLVVVTATLASIGTAGVSGAGMVMLAMVLEAIGLPVDYIGLIVAVDRLFDMGRTCLNVTGDIACSICVTKWESGKKAVARK